MEKILNQENGEELIKKEIAKVFNSESTFMTVLKEIAFQVSAKCAQIVKYETDCKGMTWWQSAAKNVLVAPLINSFKISHSMYTILTIVDRFFESLTAYLDEIIAKLHLKKETEKKHENQLAVIRERISFNLSIKLSDSVCELLEEGIIRPPVNYTVNTFSRQLRQSMIEINVTDNEKCDAKQQTESSEKTSNETESKKIGS
jgi:hypothetical protein